MKNLKKVSALLVALVAIFSITTFKSNAAKPADFGLKEGDLISAIFSDDPDVYIVNVREYRGQPPLFALSCGIMMGRKRGPS